MKIVSLADIEAKTAHPSPEALGGFNLDQELAKACRAALKPLAKRLQEYAAEKERLQHVCERWSPDSYNEKMHELATRAQGGDEDAAVALESGAVPSKASFNEMHNRAYLELENYVNANRNLFAEAAALARPAMVPVVDKGQQILDAALQGFGLPRYELVGARNHVEFVVGQLEAAGRGHSADLQWFWGLFR